MSFYNLDGGDPQATTAMALHEAGDLMVGAVEKAVERATKEAIKDCLAELGKRLLRPRVSIELNNDGSHTITVEFPQRG